MGMFEKFHEKIQSGCNEQPTHFLLVLRENKLLSPNFAVRVHSNLPIPMEVIAQLKEFSINSELSFKPFYYM
jgi:hypothetical protein